MSPYPAKLTPFFHYLIIFVLTIAVYWNSLSGQFFWDDIFLITYNDAIKGLSFSNIKAFFADKDAYYSAPGEIYRPFYLLSFALNYRFNGLNPAGYHILNLSLHLIDSLLVYLLFFRIAGDRRVSIVGALIFALHPVHTESVSWIKGRDDLISLMFILLAVLAYGGLNGGKRNARSYGMSILAYVFALLSKETAIMLLPLLILYDLLLERKPRLWRYAPFLFIAILYLYIRTSVLGQVAQTGRWTSGVLEAVYTLTKSIGYYLKLQFLPINLCSDYGLYPMTKHLDLGVVLSLLAVLAVAMVLYGSKNQKRVYDKKVGMLSKISFFLSCPKSLVGHPAFKDMDSRLNNAGMTFWRTRTLPTNLSHTQSKNRVLHFGILWFIVTLLPVLNIVPIKAGLAERFLYIPSVGFSLASAILLDRFWDRRVATFFVFILVFCFIGVVHRNTLWQSDQRMLLDTISKFPSNARAHYNLGNVYKDRQDWDMALYHSKEAVRLNPNYSEARNQMGGIYLIRGETASALAEYEKAVSSDPKNAEARYNLAMVMEMQGDIGEALVHYKAFVEIAPRFLQGAVLQVKQRITDIEAKLEERGKI